MDYEEVMKSVSGIREVATGIVQGLIQDGFSEEQAREIAVHVLTYK